MKKIAFATFAAMAFAQASFAATVCTSKPNQNGGTVQVTISENDAGQPTVSLFAQGGMAHFVSSSGPIVATPNHQPDGTFYSFVDSFGQKGTVALLTTNIGGKLQTTATSNFGLWKDATMFCK